MAERELSPEETQELLGLLDEQPKKKGRAAAKTPPTDPVAPQVRQDVTQPVSPGAAPKAEVAEKPKAKPSKPVPEEQLRAGMRVICGLTWRLSAFIAWLVARKTHTLNELTDEEKEAWVTESMGFARAIPSLMVVASVLGFPAYLFQLIAKKLQPRPDAKLAEKTAQQKTEQPKLAAVPNG